MTNKRMPSEPDLFPEIDAVLREEPKMPSEPKIAASPIVGIGPDPLLSGDRSIRNSSSIQEKQKPLEEPPPRRASQQTLIGHQEKENLHNTPIPKAVQTSPGMPVYSPFADNDEITEITPAEDLVVPSSELKTVATSTIAAVEQNPPQAPAVPRPKLPTRPPLDSKLSASQLHEPPPLPPKKVSALDLDVRASETNSVRERLPSVADERSGITKAPSISEVAAQEKQNTLRQSLPPPPKPMSTIGTQNVAQPPPPSQVSFDEKSKEGSSKLKMAAPAPVPLTLSKGADPPKRQKPWWEELFNEDYMRASPPLTKEQIERECTFIDESLALEQGAAILDLGCGTGEHAIELAKRGYQLVGYDLSLHMLSHASDSAQENNLKLNLLQGDAREFSFNEVFDGAYSWNMSFGYFDDENNKLVLQNLYKGLKRGGQLLLDLLNRDYAIKTLPSSAWFEGDGCICMDESNLDFVASRLRVKRTMMIEDGRSREYEYNIRIYSLHEIAKLLSEIGFRVVEVSGRTATPGVFFGNESPRILILAEKS